MKQGGDPSAGSATLGQWGLSTRSDRQPGSLSSGWTLVCLTGSFSEQPSQAIGQDRSRLLVLYMAGKGLPELADNGYLWSQE